MNLDLIIKDLLDIIHDVKQAGVRAYENRKEAERVHTRVDSEWKNYEKAYDMTSDGLADASQALDNANDDFLNIEEMLKKIVEDIKYEELSAKVQGK